MGAVRPHPEIALMATQQLSQSALRVAQEQFIDALPSIQRTIRFQTRSWPERCRAEARADALAATWHSWIGLVKRGVDPRAVGPTGIAWNAVRYTKNGRRLGTARGKGAGLDLFDRRAQERLGIKLVSIDTAGGPDLQTGREDWRQWLATDRRISPADAACFAIDFAAWLAALPPRKRRVAELLALGHGTGEAAAILAVTPAAISIARGWLESSWRAFEGQLERKAAPDGRRSKGRPRGAEPRMRRRRRRAYPAPALHVAS
jgi:hypothetical protein